MTQEEIFVEATAVYEITSRSSKPAASRHCRSMRGTSRNALFRAVSKHEVLGIVLLLRDVLARSLFEKYQHDFSRLKEGTRCLRARGESHRQYCWR